MGVLCPCPPVRNDIVTPRHLLFFANFKSEFYKIDNWILEKTHTDEPRSVSKVLLLKGDFIKTKSSSDFTGGDFAG